MPNPEFFTLSEIKVNKPEIPANLPKKREVPEMPKIIPDEAPIYSPAVPSQPLPPTKAPLEPVPIKR